MQAGIYSYVDINVRRLNQIMFSTVDVCLVVWLVSLGGSRHNKNGVEGKRVKTMPEPETMKTINRMLDSMRKVIRNFEDTVVNNDTQLKFEETTSLNLSDIPSVVDTKNETAVQSFQRDYRLYFALLQAEADPGSLLTEFRGEIIYLTGVEDYRKLAILMAQLSYLLPQLKGKEISKEKVDWEDEIEVIRAFKQLGLVDEDILNTARAFHRIKPSKSTNKRMRIHAPDIEREALTQFKNCYKEDFVLEAALMPDAHSGYVAPIGAVIKTKGAVVPAWVGYDIGCGMIAVKISDNITEQEVIQQRAEKIFKEVNKIVPMGVGGYNREGQPMYLIEKMESALEKLRECTTYERLYEEVYDRSGPSLGTLGSGNHFIEISTHNDETWLVIHSGSRGVGHRIGTTFMKLASGSHRRYESTHAIKDPEVRDEYMHFQDYCLEFALLNRMSMAMKVQEAIGRITGIFYDTYANLWTNKNHNHCIKLEDRVFLHRKGATSSDKGERGVIPGNMRDGCYLVEGLGNDEFLRSSSHGAGRQMSRVQAKNNVELDTFKETMTGIVAPVNVKTIDESPFAYKNISRVMEFQKKSVKIVKHLKPIINWKGY